MFFRKNPMRGGRHNALSRPDMRRLLLQKPFVSAGVWHDGQPGQSGRRVQVGLCDDGSVSVVADGAEIFRYPIKQVYVFPHMGGGGLDLQAGREMGGPRVTLHWSVSVR